MKYLLIAFGLLSACSLAGCAGGFGSSIAPEARGSSSSFDSISFRRIGDRGGASFYARGNGIAWCQTVVQDQRENRIERRYSLDLNQQEMDRLSELLTIYDAFHITLSGSGRQGRGPVTNILLSGRAGRNRIQGTDDEPHGGFQALQIQLRTFVHEVARRRTPLREGRFEDDWRPSGF